MSNRFAEWQVYALVGPPRGAFSSIHPTPDSTLQYAAFALFVLAVGHTFAARQFERLSHRFPNHSGVFHLLGEVEIVFGFWAIILILGMALMMGGDQALAYAESRNYTEPLFVFVVIVIAASPVLMVAATWQWNSAFNLRDLRMEGCYRRGAQCHHRDFLASPASSRSGAGDHRDTLAGADTCAASASRPARRCSAACSPSGGIPWSVPDVPGLYASLRKTSESAHHQGSPAGRLLSGRRIPRALPCSSVASRTSRSARVACSRGRLARRR